MNPPAVRKLYIAGSLLPKVVRMCARTTGVTADAWGASGKLQKEWRLIWLPYHVML